MKRKPKMLVFALWLLNRNCKHMTPEYEIDVANCLRADAMRKEKQKFL